MNPPPVKDMGVGKNTLPGLRIHSFPAPVCSSVYKRINPGPDIGVKKRKKKGFNLVVISIKSCTFQKIKNQVVYVKRRAAGIDYIFSGVSTEVYEIPIPVNISFQVGLPQLVMKTIIDKTTGKVHGDRQVFSSLLQARMENELIIKRFPVLCRVQLLSSNS